MAQLSLTPYATGLIGIDLERQKVASEQSLGSNRDGP